MSNRKRDKWFRWWSIPLGLLAGIAGVAAIVILASGTKPGPTQGDVTPILTIIPASTSTQYVYEGIVPTGTPTSSSPVIDGMSIGQYVQIVGTGGEGLRLRTDAGVNAKIRFLGYESEVFMIADGPVMIDNYTWWKLVAPYDDTRTGWAAASFLQIVDLNKKTPSP